MSYTIRSLVQKQALSEMCLEKNQADNEWQEQSLSNVLDQWQDIYQAIYEKFPFIQGVVDVELAVENFLESIPYRNLTITAAKDLAGLFAQTLIDFCAGYNRILAIYE